MGSDRLKFRAWNKKYKKYISENRVCICNGNAYYLDPYGEEIFLDENSFVIEQCTGIKDQNGKLIYDGDVLSFYNPLTGAHDECRVARICTFDRTYLDGAYCAVIGNIHESK